MQSVVYEGKEIIPGKVVCVGRNYVEHIFELDNEIPENMVLFNKPNSAVTDTLHFIQSDCRFEGEICFLIGGGEISGIGFGLDLTKADVQNYLKQKGLPWERAKAFDGSAVLSHFVPYKGNMESVEMKVWLNGTLQQHATYDLMIYKPQQIIDEIKTFMTLEDGDIIMSGTPKGVTTYQKGDLVEAKIWLDEKLVLKRAFSAQ